MEVRKMSNSSTTTEAVLIEPIHPGEILMEDFIEDLGTTQNKLAVLRNFRGDLDDRPVPLRTAGRA